MRLLYEARTRHYLGHYVCTVCSLREPFVDGSCKVLDVLGRERGAAERSGEPRDAVSRERGGKNRDMSPPCPLCSLVWCGIAIETASAHVARDGPPSRGAVSGGSALVCLCECVVGRCADSRGLLRHKRSSNQKRTRSKALRVCANGLCVDALHAFSDSVSLQLRPPAAARHRAPAGLALRHCSFRSWSLVLKSCPNLSFAQGSTS